MNGISNWFGGVSTAWDKFWFMPRSGKSLGLIRLLTGLMVFWTHLIWTPLLQRFLGPGGMLPPTYRRDFLDSVFAWSHFDWISSSSLLFGVHVFALVVMLMFALGFWTRVTGVVTAFFVISYANRASGALFGLDQIAGFLVLYLAISNCGQSFSLARRFGIGSASKTKSVGNNIVIRLMQIHLCIVYLFAGLGKCQGETWWNGEAIWGALASFEYQTIDMTWMAHHMWLVSVLTLVTLIFEVGYIALIWSKLTRPVMLMLAVPLHLGIGLCMGMFEFGLIMLIANLAFWESDGSSIESVSRDA